MSDFLQRLTRFALAFIAFFALSANLLFAAEKNASWENLTPETLKAEIFNSVERVEQFKFLRELGKKYGVKIYLFGGTAAGFAHYVKQDWQRRNGRTDLLEKRFDFDFTNIFRSTQDADIVVDGAPDIAKKISEEVIAKYPHMQGQKSEWEVRLLKQDYGDKIALLNNPDFLNQHTDSHSVGMIDVTELENPALVVRDLRRWENAENPPFLMDVLDSKLTFYYSSNHDSTSRAKAGNNPPLLAVVRYFTKIFQYELNPDSDGLRQVDLLISEINPTNTITPYLNSWLSNNVGKLVQNAVDVEYALKMLNETGLREKLIALIKTKIHGADTKGGVLWWLQKEALPKMPLGVSGKTAAELGIDIVAHETDSFLAYEAITKSNDGDPNVFISRQGVTGEAAVHGNGFYTRKGRVGARGTGITIRFRVDPNAREGEDFFISPGTDYVVFLNKAAFKFIPENINLGPVDYLKFIHSQELTEHDKGVMFKLEHRLKTKVHSITDEEFLEIRRLLEVEMKSESPNKLWIAKALNILITKDWRPYEDIIRLAFNQLTIPQRNIFLKISLYSLEFLNEFYEEISRLDDFAGSLYLFNLYEKSAQTNYSQKDLENLILLIKNRLQDALSFYSRDKSSPGAAYYTAWSGSRSGIVDDAWSRLLTVIINLFDPSNNVDDMKKGIDFKSLLLFLTAQFNEVHIFQHVVKSNIFQNGSDPKFLPLVAQLIKFEMPNHQQEKGDFILKLKEAFYNQRAQDYSSDIDEIYESLIQLLDQGKISNRSIIFILETLGAADHAGEFSQLFLKALKSKNQDVVESALKQIFVSPSLQHPNLDWLKAIARAVSNELNKGFNPKELEKRIKEIERKLKIEDCKIKLREFWSGLKAKVGIKK